MTKGDEIFSVIFITVAFFAVYNRIRIAIHNKEHKNKFKTNLNHEKKK